MRRKPLLSLFLCLQFACTDHDPSTSATDTLGTAPDDTGDPSGDPTTPDPPTTGGPDSGDPAAPRSVDLLFVIDNSGSMAEEQPRLVAAFPTLLALLEDPNDPIDYRIGFTTTDAGNPRCPNTSPENGNLVLSSCLDRVQDGQFMSFDTDYSDACTAACARTDGDLPVAPTATDVDDTKQPRKWIERIGGVSNLGDVPIAEAFACYAPQGVAGCGFESHLESTYKALAASKSPNSKNNFGFLREDAHLAIIILSDETDCSSNPDFTEIFTTNKAFWFDPAIDVAPSSSMCWKAGVACDGAAPIYSACNAENFDIDASPGAADEAAVLWPVRKYVDFVTTLEQQKQQQNPGAQVFVTLITGVPIGYESHDSEIDWQDSPDLAPGGFQSLFGIGPGCIVGPADAPTATAVPPVREREFAEAFNDDPDSGRNLYSVCGDDYSAALADLGQRIRGL